MRSFALALVLLVLPVGAGAQDFFDETRLSAFGGVGFDSTLTGNVVSTASGSLAGVPLVLDNVTFSDVYGTLARLRFGVGYRFDDQSQILVAFGYAAGGGSRAAIGVAPGLPYVGQFEDLSEKSLEVGYRFHLPAQGRVHPYVGGWTGVTRASRINATLSLPGQSQPPINLPVLDSSAAALLSGGGGMVLALSDRVGLNVDAELRWRSGLNSANVLVGTGLESIGSSSARWSIPVTFGVVVNFGADRP